ncbi:tetratricopeptide repeat protein [Spirulina major CS-329]|jgi:tetratricopeptide (TPR) repeat protein|uniref:tetratricopeptide repeat protein n=1 Tax=Spirulina TaxID=1154 RepID=UPI000933D849|nr:MULTISPECIES: tetratricopeptide repeat protein [Spirulina]MDB9496288.1 tetratricopeptide repeat protein [Spirulina subsalsa CS-330]MDB9502467.1 tetratricopeptide repeat protein [Spirulina major CS-329]
MNEFLPTLYILILFVLVSGAAIFVFRQIWRTRQQERRFETLQQALTKADCTTKDYYEFGSLCLDKKLYVQSVLVFQRGLKAAEKEEVESENIALMYNAMGFAYFAQEQYDLAIRNYKEAIKLYPDYVIALNNLGNVYEKKKLVAQALNVYEQVLGFDPDNAIAKKRAESMRKRLAPTS